MDMHCKYPERTLQTFFRWLMEQIISSCNNAPSQHISKGLQKSSMTQLVAWTIASSRRIDITLDRRSTLTSLHRSTDVQNLVEEPLTFLELGNSTGKRRMSMESTEMIRDVQEMWMDTSSMCPRMISES